MLALLRQCGVGSGRREDVCLRHLLPAVLPLGPLVASPGPGEASALVAVQVWRTHGLATAPPPPFSRRATSCGGCVEAEAGAVGVLGRSAAKSQRCNVQKRGGGGLHGTGGPPNDGKVNGLLCPRLLSEPMLRCMSCCVLEAH